MHTCPQDARHRCTPDAMRACRLAREAQARHDAARLAAMSDAAIRDIGLHRGDIRSAVRGDRTR